MAGIAFRGRRASQQLIDAILDYERITKAKFTPIWQLSYSFAAASAGTHSGGGAADTNWISNTNRLKARTMGFWPNQRHIYQGFAMNHEHWLVFGDPTMASGLRFQESELRAGRNGLAGRGRDTGPRPAKIVTYAQWKRAQITKANTDSKILIGGKTYSPITSVSASWINRSTSGVVSRNVYWLQVWLRRAGLYKGPLDGKKGKMTMAAVAAQRKKWGWGPNKYVTPEFLKKLRTQANSSLKVSAK